MFLNCGMLCNGCATGGDDALRAALLQRGRIVDDDHPPDALVGVRDRPLGILLHDNTGTVRQRRIRHGVVDVGADLDDRLGAGIVREAPRVVKAGRWIRLCRTHFASALLSSDTTS
uniref:(northern house mosquito) hypothetical protein n=1 Tax=Culex pipiens TaxID=7175 RepID=A0A8D8KN26_CULPI